MTRQMRLQTLRSCARTTAVAALAFAALATAAPPAGTSGLDLSALDRSVAPGDDFFRFANGTWVANTQIPPDRSSYGSGAILDELTVKRTSDLLNQAAHTARGGTPARAVGDYYSSFLDEGRIEGIGTAPLKPALKRIDAINDRATLARALGGTLRADVDVLNSTNLHTENLFGLWVAQDLSDPKKYSPFLLQGGLVMPDRDYYLNPSQKMADIRTQYQDHIVRVLTLAGVPDARAAAARAYDLEMRIAQAHATRADSEDVLKGNNHWSRSQLSERAPGLDWSAFLGSAGLGHQGEFVVWQPQALIALSGLTASVPLATWRDYLRFHLVERESPYLPKAFVDESFSFHDHILSGTPEQKARWKRAVDETNHALPQAVGKLYVEKYFPASEKARAEVMVHNLLAAFAQRIDKLEWMAPQTRARAKEKLAALKVSVGYPDVWRSYSGLRVSPGDAYGNAERAEQFELARNLAKLGKPVDRAEWAMTPQEVNAVNLPAMNAINFPAAILQPPYFDPARDPVLDYGAIGATIGHEISHSFDDEGALFDASGRLENWWTKEDFAHFQAAGERLAAQYDGYHPYPDISVNGKQTLSENIADVAGLSAAYDAWRLSLGGKAPAGADGFSPDQLFFLSFAQSWQNKIREAAMRRRIVTDGHAPAEYRADTVRNLDPWYSAFSVQPTQKLYLAPAQRAPIW